MNVTAKYMAAPIFGLCLVMSSALYAQEADTSVDPAATQTRAQTQTRDQSGMGLSLIHI